MTKTIAKRKHYMNGGRSLRHFNLSDKLDSLRGSLGDMTTNISDKTSDLVLKSIRSAKRQSLNAQKNVSRFIVKRPYKSLGVTAVAFLCLGYLMRR